MGDPNGIGPEVLIRALQNLHPFNTWHPWVFGDKEILNQVSKHLKTQLVFETASTQSIDTEREFPSDTWTIPVVDLAVKSGRSWSPGTLCAWGGESAYTFLRTAIKDALQEKIHAIVTAPLCKEALHAAGHHFPGHTEMLSHYTNGARPVMMLNVEPLRAIHVTAHMSLRRAIDWLTPDRIVEVMQIGHKALQSLGIANPRLGIPGLNPHASEQGLFGDEEQDIIVPAIEKARSLGIHCEGPLPPDTVFLKHQEGLFDAVIALYHDQAHIPLKLLGFERGVNVTLGLPIIRTSVDHGTAFDRAASFSANPGSMIQALLLAQQMAGFSFAEKPS